MKKVKYFETEDGKLLKTAEFDGYNINDRTFEGLMFQVDVNEDGTLKVYVKTEDDVCHQRIAKRSRDGEANIPLIYLENCSNYHDNMLNEFMSKRICTNQLILNGNVNIYENKAQLETWISNIDRFIYN
jgi:deoxyadenosine/deoxycytidine kinase